MSNIEEGLLKPRPSLFTLISHPSRCNDEQKEGERRKSSLLSHDALRTVENRRSSANIEENIANNVASQEDDFASALTLREGQEGELKDCLNDGTILSPNLVNELQGDAPKTLSFLKSIKGVIVQLIVVCLCILITSIHPNLAASMKVHNIPKDHPLLDSGFKNDKFTPFIESVFLTYSNLLTFFFCLVITWFIDGARGLKLAFSPKYLGEMAVPACFYSIGDICALMALRSVDPTIPAVFGQLKLVVTAYLYRVALKRKLRTIQWLLLHVLLVVVCAYLYVDLLDKSVLDVVKTNNVNLLDPSKASDAASMIRLDKDINSINSQVNFAMGASVMDLFNDKMRTVRDVIVHNFNVKELLSGLGEGSANAGIFLLLMRLLLTAPAGIATDRIMKGNDLPFYIQMIHTALPMAFCALGVSFVAGYYKGQLHAIPFGMFDAPLTAVMTGSYTGYWSTWVWMFGLWSSLRQVVSCLLLKKLDALWKGISDVFALSITFLLTHFVFKENGTDYVSKHKPLHAFWKAEVLLLVGIMGIVGCYILSKAKSTPVTPTPSIPDENKDTVKST